MARPRALPLGLALRVYKAMEGFMGHLQDKLLAEPAWY
jgi:hypothetical protein